MEDQAGTGRILFLAGNLRFLGGLFCLGIFLLYQKNKGQATLCDLPVQSVKLRDAKNEKVCYELSAVAAYIMSAIKV